jgi:hypothetical protein
LCIAASLDRAAPNKCELLHTNAKKLVTAVVRRGRSSLASNLQFLAADYGPKAVDAAPSARSSSGRGLSRDGPDASDLASPLKRAGSPLQHFLSPARAPEWQLRVMNGKAQNEQMFSGLPR